MAPSTKDRPLTDAELAWWTEHIDGAAFAYLCMKRDARKRGRLNDADAQWMEDIIASYSGRTASEMTQFRDRLQNLLDLRSIDRTLEKTLV